jgi:hypothetical protein
MYLLENPKSISNIENGIILEKQSGEKLNLMIDDWVEFQTWKGDFQIGQVLGFHVNTTNFLQPNAIVFVKIWNTYTNTFNSREGEIALNTNVPKYNSDGIWTTLNKVSSDMNPTKRKEFIQNRQEERDRLIHKTKLKSIHDEYDTLPPNLVTGYPGGIEFEKAKKRFETHKRAGKRKRKTKRILHKRRK